MSELILKPLEVTDATELFGLVNRNRARLKKFWWESTTRSSLDSQAFITATHQREHASEKPVSLSRGMFVDEWLIGVGGIHSIDWKLGRAALGYWVDEAEDGNGYASEAVRQLSRIAFSDLGLNTITISPRESNVASRHVAEHNGFRLERIDREPEWQLAEDEAVPLVAHYALTADQYKAR